MKKTKDNIFGKLTGLDDEIVGRIAEKYPDIGNAEIGRICRKTRKKLELRDTCSDMAEIVSGTDKVITLRRKRFASMAAAFLIIAASVPGMYFAMRHIPVEQNEEDNLPIITDASNTPNITGTSNNSASIKNNNSTTEAAAPDTTDNSKEETTASVTQDPTEAPDHTTMPVKTTSPITTTTEICSPPLTQLPLTTAMTQNPVVTGKLRKITTNDVIRLSRKGDALTWSDFKEYECKEIGSGLLILEFILDDNFKLIVGGSPSIKPDYIDLVHSHGESIDIRTENVESFINNILNPNISSKQEKLTIDDVIKLSKKGDALTWSDFEKYEHTDIGSGLFVWQFLLEDNFELLVGGGYIYEKPSYIRIKHSHGESIDIRTENVETFVSRLSANTSRITLEQAKKIISNAGAPDSYSDVEYSQRIMKEFNRICGCADVVYDKRLGDYTSIYEYWLSDERKEVIIIMPEQASIQYAKDINSNNPWMTLIPSQSDLDG